MRWDGGDNAGFTTGEPWLPIGHDIEHRNVAHQLRHDRSILWLYRRLIRLRQNEPALLSGRFQPQRSQGDVLLFERRLEGSRLLVDDVRGNRRPGSERLYRRGSRCRGYSSAVAQVGPPGDVAIMELVEAPVSFVDTRNKGRPRALRVKPGLEETVRRRLARAQLLQPVRQSAAVKDPAGTTGRLPKAVDRVRRRLARAQLLQPVRQSAAVKDPAGTTGRLPKAVDRDGQLVRIAFPLGTFPQQVKDAGVPSFFDRVKKLKLSRQRRYTSPTSSACVAAHSIPSTAGA